MASFIWASYGGLWHVHRQGTVLAELSSNPNWKKIEQHVFDGVPDRGGIDLKEITSTSWAGHQANYSEFILTQGAILYEEWCGQLALMTQAPPKKVKAETFQFPSNPSGGKFVNWSAIDAPGVLQESSFLKAEVQPALLTTYASNVTHLDALLKWYRFFKEARNSVVHHGGIARTENVTAYAKAATTPLKSIGMKRDFSGAPPVVGAKIDLSLADSVLLLGIIQRLSYGFDAKYCHTSQAEVELKDRIRCALLESPAPKQATAQKRASWVKNFLVHRAGISPQSYATAEQWLRAGGLINIKAI